MELNLDDHELDIPCPGCGQKTAVRIGQARAEKQYICSGCAKTVRLDVEDFEAGIAKAEESLEQLRRTLKGFGKGF